VEVEQTPVLANHAVDLSQKDWPDAMQNGRDAVVDNGTGENAARQIFWPGVFDSQVAGQPAQLSVYQFKFTFVFIPSSIRAVAS
jgi:hypothetical protein